MVRQPELALWGPSLTVNGPAVGSRVRIYFRPNDVYLTSAPETPAGRGKIVPVGSGAPLIEHAVEVGRPPVVAHVPRCPRQRF